MLDIILDKLKLLLKNPMSIFIYGILTKWYIIVMVPAVVVTFWIFKGLTDAGILQTAENVVSAALTETKSVAKNCIPKILSFGDFWECLQNPPEYTPEKDEIKFLEDTKNLLNLDNYTQTPDPYAE